MPALTAALLLLADSRFPAGAHAHSGSVAAAVEARTVYDEPTLALFLAGRLATTGLVAAAAAARAAFLATTPDAITQLRALDRDVDARTPSAAARDASRAQGRGIVRAASVAWPAPVLALVDPRPHAPIALGLAVVAAGSGPAEAATVAATSAVSGPASAALRLLGLDPFNVAALLARLASQVDDVAARAVACADLSVPLPAGSAPLLDLLAQAHARAEVRLFAS